MPRTLEPQYVAETIDWSGHLIPRQMISHLFPTCIVRIAIRDKDSQCTEMIYFEITKIKDGTFWGIAQDTYRLNEWVGIKDGDQFTFRKEHINEIPLEWQPKRFRKSVASLEERITDQGYGPTGLR